MIWKTVYLCEYNSHKCGKYTSFVEFQNGRIKPELANKIGEIRE